MEKEFIPYEQALALKELGFDEKCLSYPISSTDASGRTWTSVLVAPLYQQAFRWFREKYDLHSSIESFNQDENGNDIEYTYTYCVVTNKVLPKEWNKFFSAYEDAELECLKKLIQIVKNK